MNENHRQPVFPDYFARVISGGGKSPSSMNSARTNFSMTRSSLVQRLNLLRPTKAYFFDRFFGTLTPFFALPKDLSQSPVLF